MKGGYDYNEEDQYEEPLDPSSTVDFHMKGLKGKQTSNIHSLSTVKHSKNVLNRENEPSSVVSLC